MGSPRRRPGTTTSTIAEKYNGQDLNGDGQPDYGSCIAKKKGAQSYWWIISIAAGLLQAKGTNEGAFFDTTNMNPLFGPNEAITKALETYAKTATFGPPDELNMDVGGTRGLFTTGRCALSMDWGDIGTLTPGTYAQDKTGATITPGWKEVLDRSTGKLVPCDATTCPNAVDGVNYAPFASFGGWSGAINAAAPKPNQDAAYDFLSYMSSPPNSGVDVTLGKTGYNPYRTSHFTNIQPVDRCRPLRGRRQELSWRDPGQPPEPQHGARHAHPADQALRAGRA